MNEKEKAFIADLSDLLKKYDVRIERDTNYDGYDNACGDNYTFVGNTINVDIDDI